MRDHSLFRFVVGTLARFFSLITSIYKLNFLCQNRKTALMIRILQQEVKNARTVHKKDTSVMIHELRSSGLVRIYKTCCC